MVSKETKIVNKEGFHMRPANNFIREMAKLLAGRIWKPSLFTIFVSLDTIVIPPVYLEVPAAAFAALASAFSFLISARVVWFFLVRNSIPMPAKAPMTRASR